MNDCAHALRTIHSLIASAPLAILLGAGVARGDEKAPIYWKGKRFDTASLPADLGVAPRATIAEWEPWARKAGYRMDLDAGGRVLLLVPSGSARAEKLMQLVVRGETWFDDLLPVPKPTTSKPASGAGKTSKSPPVPSPVPTDEIPEDPEGPPPGEKPGSSSAGASGAPAVPSPWGSGSDAPDSKTAALIALADEKDQTSVLELLAAAHPELKSWAAGAGTELGFVLEVPLTAAFVESATGQEEWNPDHEILNRLVRVLTLRRFGQMPNWLVHAIAWEAETAFDGSIWVYPYRAEFVYTVEHTAWPLDLVREFEDRAKKALGIEELTRWKRGTWDGESARHAFGLFHFLAATKRDALSGLLVDLREHRDKTNRRTGEDDTWTRDPSWEATPAAQLAILHGRCGEKVLEEASAWLAKPSSQRPRPAPRDAPTKVRGGG